MRVLLVQLSLVMAVTPLALPDHASSGASTEAQNWFRPRVQKSSNEVSDDPVGDQISELRDRMEEVLDDLAKIKLSMFLNQNKENVFESRLEKCAKELSEGNEIGAMKHWEDIQIHLATYDQSKTIATQLVDMVDLDNRRNVMTLIHFARYMNVPQVYELIVARLKKLDFFFRFPETFVLANDIKNVCGTSQTVFKDLPQALRDVTSNVVNLMNVKTSGYLYYQSVPEAFYTWFSPHKNNRNYFDHMDESKKPRGQWEFLISGGDKIRVVNSYNGNILLDPKALFSVELVSDSELRLKVDQAANKSLIGKYLIGKPKSRGEQFSHIDFVEAGSATPEQLKWRVQALRPRTMPEKIQRC